MTIQEESAVFYLLYCIFTLSAIYAIMIVTNNSCIYLKGGKN